MSLRPAAGDGPGACRRASVRAAKTSAAATAVARPAGLARLPDCTGSARDDGKHERRRVLRVVEDGLLGLHDPRGAERGLARVEVAVEAGEVAARDVEPDPVPGLE